MKTRSIIFSALILLIAVANTSKGQEKFLIITKDSIAQFPLIDKNGKTILIKPKNKASKIFIAEINPETTKIKTEEYILFSIYRFKDGAHISNLCNYEIQDTNLSNLFEVQESDGEALLLDDKTTNFYHFLVRELNKSNSSTTRGAGNIFKKNQPKEFCCKEDFKIEWDENIVSHRVALYDIEKNSEIWVSSNITTPYVNDSIIDLMPFKEKQYNLIVQASYTDGTKVKSYDYNFSIRPLVFLTQNDFFPISDSIKVEWKSAKPITQIQIREKKTGKVLWTSNNYKQNYWRYIDHSTNMKEGLKTGIYYELGIRLKNNQSENEYVFDLKTTFTKKEYSELF